MDYLLSCTHPRYVSYFQFLHAYANGCHILNLPFVESSAKIEFEHMLRRRFMGVANVDSRTIDHLVLQVAWIPLLPRSFFNRAIPSNNNNKSRKKTFSSRKASHLTVSIPPLPRSSSLRIVTTVESPMAKESPSIKPAPLDIQKQPTKASLKKAKTFPAPVSAVAVPDCDTDLFELNFDTQFKLAEDCCFTLAKHEDFIFKPRGMSRSNWVTEFPIGSEALSTGIYD